MLGMLWDAGIAPSATVFPPNGRRLPAARESETPLEITRGEASTLLAGLVFFPASLCSTTTGAGR
jgi:hypothetical protein